METLNYAMLIEATSQQVWQVLWNPDNYGQWTYYFLLTSSIHSDWKVNGKTLFLDADRMAGCLPLSRWRNLRH